MAEIQPRQPDDSGEPEAGRSRKAVRYGVPVAVAGLVAATVGLVPALAGTGAPDLPKITAEQLVAKMAASDVQRLSGTVKLSTDLGLPELPGMGSSGEGSGSPFGHGGGGGGESADPQSKLMSLASGEHTLRVAADGPEKQRVSVVEEAAEYSVIRNGDEVWAYDSANAAAHHAKVPAAGKSAEKHKKGFDGKFGESLGDATPQEAAKQALKAVDGSTSVSVDGTASVAGRDAHQLVIEPKGAPHSTVESVRVAVDAKTGTPLKFTLTPKGGGKPAVDVAYTDVDFSAPDAGTFDFTPPKGTDITEAEPGDDTSEPKPGAQQRPRRGMPQGESYASRTETVGEGWGTVAVIENAGAVPGSPAAGSGETKGRGSGEGRQLLDSFTEKAKGDFGTGRVVSTRLVNALLTEDGTLYVGAVTKEGLIKAADAAD